MIPLTCFQINAVIGRRSLSRNMKSVTPSEREEENEENILTENKTAQRDRGGPTLGKRE